MSTVNSSSSSTPLGNMNSFTRFMVIYPIMLKYFSLGLDLQTTNWHYHPHTAMTKSDTI